MDGSKKRKSCVNKLCPTHCLMTSEFICATTCTANHTVVEHIKSTCSGRREPRMHQIGFLAYFASVMAWKSTGSRRPQQACPFSDPYPARPAPVCWLYPNLSVIGRIFAN